MLKALLVKKQYGTYMAEERMERATVRNYGVVIAILSYNAQVLLVKKPPG